MTSLGSGERTVISLLEKLPLLPGAVDDRIEVLGMLDGPDLRADHEVVGVDVERAAPRRNGFAVAAVREQLECAGLHPLLGARALQWLILEKALEVVLDAYVGNVEIVVMRISEDTRAINEESRWD